MGSKEEIGESKLLELADYGRPDKTTVAGNEDLGGFVGKERVLGSSCEREKTKLGLSVGRSGTLRPGNEGMFFKN